MAKNVVASSHSTKAATFDATSSVYRLVDPPDVVLAGREYREENVFAFDVRASKVEAFRARVRELRLILP